MKRKLNKKACYATAIVVGLTGATEGQEAAKPAATEKKADPNVLESVTVVGSDEAEFKLAGSGSHVDAEEFRNKGYTNLKQIAAKEPSVFVRDEDGYGNFPNISLRGVDGTRSNKVTLMEDGILTAPSPYAAPAAYYSPKAGRMAGIEFLKGSSQVKYGPHTTGGVVNYLSTAIPQEGDKKFFSRTTYGSDNTFFNHTHYGDELATEAGRFGYLLEMHTQNTDGYRNIEGSNGDSGYSLYEPMLKLFWEPNTALSQRFEMKAGFTSFDANESYSGITEEDLRRNPDRRYSGTQFDHHTAEQWRSYGKWIAEPSDALRLESTLYFNEFKRNWAKLDAVNGKNVGQALMNPGHLATMKGLAPGNITTRDAFRDHEAYGWQNQANFRFDAGQTEHDLAVGVRLHYDRAGGTNQAITYDSDSMGGFGAANPAAVGSAGLSEVFAKAVFIEDEIKIGALTLLPGVRYEWLDVKNTTGAGETAAADEHLVMGGMGATYELDEKNTVFGGIYRGASPANPAGYLSGTESEESLGYELGLRHRKDDVLRAEMVGFFTDYENLIAPEVGVGGGGLTASKNGGSAQAYGLEGIVEYDYGKSAGLNVGIPVYASMTYTQAEFKGMSGERLGTGAGIFAGATDGSEIPYIPEWKLAVGIGLTHEKWGVNLDASFNTSTWGTGFNGHERLNDDDTLGTPTAVDGKVDSLLIFDLSSHYNLTENVKLVGGVHNIFEDQGIISRAPLGPRANAPRTLFAGAEISF